MRLGLALASTRGVNAASRLFGRGQGTVAGGRVGLAIEPQLLQRLTAHVDVSLVTGTNGKTTTTRLLCVALGADGTRVVSNDTGSNMPPGHVAALASDRAATRAVLEVDEIYLPRVLTATAATAVVLLNLSRDQLDRSNEVRMVANRWRAALAAAPHTAVIANADDPLVVWGAGLAAHVHWVGAGLRWRLDATGCPSCEGRIAFDDGDPGWSCAQGCGFTRPVPEATWHGSDITLADGTTRPLSLALPGRFNRSNALMAVVAATTQGVAPDDAVAAVGAVDHVAGRFTVRAIGGARARLMLAKNPAGWSELLDLVADESTPVVVSINARIADGADPSWLWDAPFERLVGRRVVATGDRRHDLSVRLHYAGVEHTVVEDPARALTVAAAASDPHQLVDAIGNYTAFHDFLAMGESTVTPDAGAAEVSSR